MIRQVFRRARGAAGFPLGLAIALLAWSCSSPRGPALFTIAVHYEITTFDPHAANRLANYSVLSNVYEPLVTTDADLKVEPRLAASWESPDPLTWILSLRPGVRFHSGRSLTSADVVYSLQRLLSGPDLQMRGFAVDIAQVAEVGPLKVRIVTLRPTRALLNKLHFLAIVPAGSTREALRGATDGTGPYRLESSQEGESILLARNEDYWGRRPDLARVQFLLDRTPAQASHAFLAGEAQLAESDSKSAAALGSGRGQVLRRDSVFVTYLGYDVARQTTPFCSVRPNPFLKRDVRQAIHAALDRRRLIAGLSSAALVASQPVPRSIFGFNPGIREPKHDLDRARALLRLAGLAGGFAVTLHVRKNHAEAAFLVKDQLAPLGIVLDVRVVPAPEFYEIVGRREATMWMAGFGCPTGDASNILDDVLHSADPARSFGGLNWGDHRDADLDRAIEQSASIDDPQERRRALQQIIGRAMDELFLIPLYVDEDTWILDRAYSWRPRSDSYIRAADIGYAP